MILNQHLFPQYRKEFLSITSIILIIIGIINLYFLFNITPRSNDECLWIHEKTDDGKRVLTFRVVKFEGVTWNAGIRDGDRLLKINGKRVYNPQDASYIFDKIKKGDTVNYTVSRNGHVFETEFKVKKLLQFGGIGSALLGLIWVIVAYVVILAKHHGETQILFFKIGLGFTLLTLANLYTGNTVANPIFNYSWLLIVLDLLSLVGAAFVPFWLIKFFWKFPREFNFAKNIIVVRILNIAPILIFLIFLTYKVINIYTVDPAYISVQFVYFGLINFLSGAAIFIGLISLFINYLKLKTPKEKNPIFIILLGYTMGIAAAVYTGTLANVFSDTVFNSPEHYMPILFVAVIPVSFGYSIFRYSLMDVSDVVKKAIIYGAATISIAGLYFFSIYLIGQTVSQAIGTEYQGAIAGIIFILFATVFQSTKEKFQDLLTQKFYPEQFAYQKVLLRFSNEISSIVGLPNILKETRETFIESLNLDRFGILLKKENLFTLKNGHGFFNNSLILNDSGDLLVNFIETKINLKQQPVIERPDFEKVFPEDVKVLLDEGIYTIIPLRIKTKIIGLLTFGLKYSGSQFAGKDLELLVAASNQVAVSIENARLYQSEAQKLKMEVDLENARKIQENLLPKEIPQINNLDLAGIMIPAQHVAGDYYDLIKISDTKLFVVNGDVSGKGLAASFYMTKLQTMIRLFCKEDTSPKEILVKLNKLMFNEIGKNWFITVTIALFDTEKNNVKFCRAGHTPIMHYTNSAVKLYQPKGIGVGLEKGDIFDTNLAETEILLNKNDVFLFFSDGVNETMNNENEQYDLNRLSENLTDEYNHSAQEIITSIQDSLDNFRNNIDLNDDITIVAVKVI
ncbi:MAG: SpoIIE family protein phosphatase [Bacteroidetes bacterium]|nr:SpoIIE family protein phosphatase [Bacteroidota bacterium]